MRKEFAPYRVDPFSEGLQAVPRGSALFAKMFDLVWKAERVNWGNELHCLNYLLIRSHELINFPRIN